MSPQQPFWLIRLRFHHKEIVQINQKKSVFSLKRINFIAIYLPSLSACLKLASTQISPIYFAILKVHISQPTLNPFFCRWIFLLIYIAPLPESRIPCLLTAIEILHSVLISGKTGTNLFSSLFKWFIYRKHMLDLFTIETESLSQI